jgi:hypothetical protein
MGDGVLSIIIIEDEEGMLLILMGGLTTGLLMGRRGPLMGREGS